MKGLPRFIALVGNPLAGKDTAAKIMIDKFGVRPIDSGRPLREIAMAHYGLTRDQVYTQAGKREYVQILGKRWQVRELLGEIGNRFEEMHGDWATPWMEVRKIPADDPGPFCDPSCRKGQGLFYKDMGGVVIGLRRPDGGESGYGFDQVRSEIVDVWIENDGLARGLAPNAAMADLESKVEATLRGIAGRG